MYNGCEWLSTPIKIPDNIYTEAVEEELYKIFFEEIYNCEWFYGSKKISMRKQPLYRGKEESFFHIISGKDNPMLSDCQTDIDRVTRLRWGKEIIEHEPCMQSGNCCKGLLVWDYFDNRIRKIRRKIFHPKVNYLVILEERKDYWLYITSYRIGDTYRRQELLKEAHINGNINKKRPAT